LNIGPPRDVEIITQVTQTKPLMKKLLVPMVIGLSALTLLSGCLDLKLGGGTTTRPQTATVGQQLLDLQKAKDAGAITDAEYQTQKAKLLAN
jgi:putative oligomerization/nucleic acid binding protein